MTADGTTAPAQNRVSPFGDVVALPGRGGWTGNRGRLHEGDGSRVVVRRQQTRAWITCVLRFRDRRLAQWDAHHYTPLFLLDEAVAFAAGHRPCAECRRADYRAYQAAWVGDAGEPAPRAAAMDARLSAERALVGGRRVRRPVPWADLPDGAFVVLDDEPGVVVGDHVTLWDEGRNAYAARLDRPRRGSAQVLTPPASLAVLRSGYPVQIDPAAR